MKNSIVTDKIMYHIHKKEKYDDQWKVGNIISNVSEDFINDFYGLSMKFRDTVLFEDEDTAFEDVLNYYKKNKSMLTEDKVQHIIEDAFIFLCEFNLLKRELALEEVRYKYYPELVSRKKAIWLCESEEQLEYWKRNIKSKYVVYKVKVNGKVFVSSNELIPINADSYETCIQKAFDYWKGNIKDAHSESAEYLFEGELEVLEEI